MEGTSVLVVSEDAAMRGALSRQLDGSGFKTIAASTGPQALLNRLLWQVQMRL